MKTMSTAFAQSHDYRPELLTPEEYPCMKTMSSAFFVSMVVVPRTPPPPPEYVYVPVEGDPCAEPRLAQERFITEWNQTWEWGSHRPDYFRPMIPAPLAWLDRHHDLNVRLASFEIGRGRLTKLPAYEALHALLPLGVVRRFGLPAQRGCWPPTMVMPGCTPNDADERLARAFAHYLWPLLQPRSRPGDFSPNDPIHLLAHNLDYWLPYLDHIIQRRARELGRVAFKNDEQRRDFEEAQRRLPPDADADVLRPCFGGDVWRGEDEAWEMACELVETADEHGQLRKIIEAVRSNRVQDDFSGRWSFQREDFERKLYSKRHKVKVTFVELGDTTPVHAPDAEPDPERRLIWQDFMALLDPKERRVIVCLRNGHTRAIEIATELGYANHSPVSKALAKIRKKARKVLLS
jgi:hypothetical protein